ncbi:MAG: hypothetical protein K2Y20_15130 [Sphingomonas sp.]|nr:hypothetical protein [Sphingomonas sp.]
MRYKFALFRSVPQRPDLVNIYHGPHRYWKINLFYCTAALDFSETRPIGATTFAQAQNPARLGRWTPIPIR